VRLRGLGGVGDIKKKREGDKEIEEVVWEKTLTPPLPLPYRGGESTKEMGACSEEQHPKVMSNN